MQKWMVMCWAFSALVCAEDCANGDSCVAGHTCCDNPGNIYDCCPFDQAVCCEDQVHCCPEGTRCDVDASSCMNATASVPWVEGTSSIAMVSKSFRMVRSYDTEDDDNICPDESRCPPEYSCLRALTRFSCCPLTQAVCCEDMKHCCPGGSACDVKQCKCVSLSTNKEMPMWAKLPARKIAEWERVKEDEQETVSSISGEENSEAITEITTDITIDITAEFTTEFTNEFTTAAPLEDAMQLSLAITTTATGTEPMMEKVAAFTSPPTTTTTTTPMATTQRPAYTSREEGTSKQEVEEGGMIQCDPHTTCPLQSTCCFMSSSKKWGCCPIPKVSASFPTLTNQVSLFCTAVCCFDGEHCCPTNYKCDESRRTCYKGEVAIPWYTKVPAVEGGSVDLDSVPCDRENRCPVHFTCCQLSSGQWGCCPLYEAVCCPDQEHCCPWGYSCNVHTASCWRVSMVQLHTIPYTRVVLAKPRLDPPQEQVVHCQGVSFCTEGETCCWLSSNAWACCPTSNAVCCGDMTHCCPAGHTCGDGGTCTQDVSLQWNNWHMFFARRGQRAQTP
ncbi:Granulin [Merluccius polli]|uniref:Granulin n=1 Tax=Merluccius polli TaxID=89951 RepID=A0AA47P5W8_MERPO|nr:Granulin [Merluccius polli]